MRGGTLVILALACVGVGGGLGGVLAAVLDKPPPAAPVAASMATPATPATPAAPVATPEAASPLPTASRLRRLAARAAALTGGRVQIAVADASTVRAAASVGDSRGRVRMWSVSKVMTAIALLRAYGWADEPGRPLSAPLARAMRDALTRSSDCAQRLMTVALQRRLGDPTAARRAVTRVLRRAGADSAVVLSRASVAGAGCAPVLNASGVPDPFRLALQLGTAEWTVRDAAAFGLALGDGTYPRAVSQEVLRLLRAPKTRSNDPFAHGLDVTVDPAWGAGSALAGTRAAYKAGWGGSSGETPSFVVEQVISVRSSEGAPYGLAVTFEPPTRPVRDDPGLTRAPEAFQLVLRSLRRPLGLSPTTRTPRS